MTETKLPSSILKLRELQKQDALKIELTQNVLSAVLNKWFASDRTFTDEDLIFEMISEGADPGHAPWAVRQAWVQDAFVKHPVTGVITEKVK